MSNLREANKKIENAVVDAYQTVEDKFVERFLTEEGETVEQAKIRLKGQEESK